VKFAAIRYGKIIVSLSDEEKEALANFLRIGIGYGQEPGRYGWFPDVWYSAAPSVTVAILDRLIGQGANVPFIPDEIDLMIALADKYIRSNVDVSALKLWDDPREEIGNAFVRIWEAAHHEKQQTGAAFEMGPPRSPLKSGEMQLRTSAEVWRSRKHPQA